MPVAQGGDLVFELARQNLHADAPAFSVGRHALVARRFQSGRAFIAGDAADLFTPLAGRATTPP